MERAPRVAVPLAAALLGFLAVLAASRPPQVPRELRRLELADLIRQEDARVRELRGELRELEAGLAATARGQAATGRRAAGLRQRVRAVAIRSGAAALEGPGVVVTLDDSSASRSPSGDPNDLIVHERDIQTVVNALWAAGAEAIAINGERLTSTSAVRCAGNTVLLHGTLHSPPYRIEAIGDTGGLRSAFPTRPGMGRLLAAVDAFGLGLSVDEARVMMPAGSTAPRLRLASPSR